MLAISCFTFLVFTARKIRSATVENGVAGFPEIKCQSDSVLVRFDTLDRFEGHSYVKGFYAIDGCNTAATNQRFSEIIVPFEACGVRRERSANPAGIFMSTTVVISFHPMFVTMVDRAYNIRCFYMEADKTVSAQVDVSFFPDSAIAGGDPDSFNASFTQFDSNMLTTGLITQTVDMPICRYEVLQETESGPPLRFARIGDMAYHRWLCEGPSEDVFCMTVHSCYVDNGSGEKFLLLDQDGCAQDRFLMNNVVYTSDLSGGQQTMVFKFADRPSVMFDCQIRLTLKQGGICQRTSDACREPARGRRSAGLQENRVVQSTSAGVSSMGEETQNTTVAVDVYSGEILVISDFGTDPEAPPTAELISQLHAMNAGSIRIEDTTEICLPKLTFAVSVTCVIVFALTLLLCFWFRTRQVGDKS